jgi:hypothetical protein
VGGTDTELRLEVSGERFDPTDDRWQRRVQLLVQELRRATGSVAFDVEPVVGRKGGAVSIVVGLGSAGVFTAVVELVRTWATRHTAVVKISLREGPIETLEISGAALEREDLRRLTEALHKQLDG